MTSRKSITKRKYPAWFTTEHDKWFTGYDGDITTNTDECWKTSCYHIDEHITQILKLKPKSFSRGRSAANFDFVDDDGFVYTLSMKSVSTLLHAISNRNIEVDEEGWFIGEFCQIKQGANYFIDLVEE